MSSTKDSQISDFKSASVPTGYKQTEVGVIPEEWEVKQLGDLGDVVRGGSPRPAGDPRYFNGSFIPWLTVASLTNIPANQLFVGETVSCLTEEGSKRSRILKNGTLAIVNSGAKTLGVAKILAVTCCANDGIAALVNQREGDRSYLCYYLNSQTTRLREVVASGNDQLNLNTTRIAGIRVPYPPSSEQESIATALSDVDALLGALDRLIAKKRDLKQAAMQQLLTGQTRLPGFHDEWQRTTLGELATFLSGGTPSRSNEAFWAGDIPWISATSLRCFEIWRSDSNVTKAAVEAGSKMAAVGASLLLVRGSALHKEILCGLVTQPVCFNQDVKALVPHANVVPRFLTWFIKGTAEEFLKLVSSAGNTAGVLDTKLLKAFEIHLPSIAEQTAIASVLSDMDVELSALEQRLAKTRALKQGMMRELLTGKTRLVAPSGTTG